VGNQIRDWQPVAANDNGIAVALNLRQQARDQGVDPARLVFAERLPRVEDHLARYRQADLFLDTHPYNAHTTAADALMAGLPVLTFEGSAFPSRVAASLLRSAGLSADSSWEAGSAGVVLRGRAIVADSTFPLPADLESDPGAA
jgi:predicted O-linked N-acetylglucosamine transferase (SPINDLY family)